MGKPICDLGRWKSMNQFTKKLYYSKKGFYMDKRGIVKKWIVVILLFAVILLAFFVNASVFLDDTDWDAGTLHNMKVFGTGVG